MTRDEMRQTVHFLANLPPWENISDDALEAIARDIQRLMTTRKPTRDDIIEVTGQYVRGAGTYFNKGEDMSHLNALLTQLANPRPQGGMSTKSF